MSIVECQRGKKCKNEDTCATKAVWQRISQSITTALEEITLQNMVDDYNAGQAAKEMTNEQEICLYGYAATTYTKPESAFRNEPYFGKVSAIPQRA